jgi:histidinol-phosphate aminotransferase
MRFPLEKVLSALARKPRVLFVANPNNPTGTLLSRDALREIFEAATHTAVVIDEAYAEFSGETVIPWIHKHANLFVVRTFSKAAGMAALRLGAVIAEQNSLGLLRRAMPPFPINIAALVAAEAALKDRVTIRRYVSRTVRLRESFAAQLSRIGVRTFPSAGNFLLADFGATGPELFARLAREGILVRERAKDISPGFVRISIGTEQEMRRLLRAIIRHWKKCERTSI